MSMRPLALVIEDDEASSEALALILDDWGAEVVCGANGDLAQNAIKERAKDLRWIITDFHLGDGPDGVTVVSKLRQTAPDARVLVLSGSFYGRAQDVGATSGYDVMQKPARASAIVAWLESG